MPILQNSLQQVLRLSKSVLLGEVELSPRSLGQETLEAGSVFRLFFFTLLCSACLTCVFYEAFFNQVWCLGLGIWVRSQARNKSKVSHDTHADAAGN